MSGGVGATSKDISLIPANEQEVTYKQQDDDIDPTTFHQSSEKKTATLYKSSTFLTFRQLNALAVITVFAASGMVSAGDFIFVIFSLIYMFFLFKTSFPLTPQSKESSVFDPNNKILPLYVLFAAIIGLFLPIAYILEGIFEGDKEGIKAAAPHVFLLASQVFMEGVAFSDKFSMPIRVFVPVFYNSRRIFTIADWLRSEFSKTEEEINSTSARRLYLGRALALANMAFWCFNLFGFLLPVYLPKAFKKYYSANKVKN